MRLSFSYTLENGDRRKQPIGPVYICFGDINKKQPRNSQAISQWLLLRYVYIYIYIDMTKY